MANRGRSLVMLVSASAALAAFVPGVFDGAAFATSASAEMADHRVTANVGGSGSTSGAGASGMLSLPIRDAANVVRARARVPVGCDRLVSPLTRSAAAFQFSRCVT